MNSKGCKCFGSEVAEEHSVMLKLALKLLDLKMSLSRKEFSVRN